MPNVLKGLRDKLNADSSVTDDLATYDFGGGAVPAIFTMDPAPLDCSQPLIILRQVSTTRFETRAQDGSEITVDVIIWGNKKHSTLALLTLADNTYNSLNRQAITVSDYQELGVFAEAPTAITDADGFPGYLIPVMVRVLEE